MTPKSASSTSSAPLLARAQHELIVSQCLALVISIRLLSQLWIVYGGQFLYWDSTHALMSLAVIAYDTLLVSWKHSPRGESKQDSHKTIDRKKSSHTLTTVPTLIYSRYAMLVLLSILCTIDIYKRRSLFSFISRVLVIYGWKISSTESLFFLENSTNASAGSDDKTLLSLRNAVRRSLTQAVYLTYVTQVVPVVTYSPKELIFSRQHAIMHSTISCAWFFVWLFVSELILMPQSDWGSTSTRIKDHRKTPSVKADSVLSKGAKPNSFSAASMGGTETFSRLKDKRHIEHVSSPKKPQNPQPSASTDTFDSVLNAMFSFLGHKRFHDFPNLIQTISSICLAGLHVLNAVDAINAMRQNDALRLVVPLLNVLLIEFTTIYSRTFGILGS